MSGGHYTPAGFAVTSTGTPGQAQLDDSGNLKVNVVAGGVGGGAMTVVDGGDVAEGTTTDPAWVSGAGTVISLLKKIASGGGGSAVSIADGSDVAEGTTTDAAVTSDSNGTVIGFLRGLVKILSSAWDSVNGRLKVDSSGVTITTTGTVTAVNDTLTLAVTGYGTVSGILTTSPDLQSFYLQGTTDGTNWVSLPHETYGLSGSANASLLTGFINTDAAVTTPVFHVNVSGMNTFRVMKAGGVVPSTWVLTATIPPYVPTSEQSRLYSYTGTGIRASATGNLLVENGIPWNTRIQDVTNTNTAQVTPASTAAAAVDPALVVRSVQLPAALGQTTMAASSPVVLASDQSNLPVSDGTTTRSTATWTSATAFSTALTISVAGYSTAVFDVLSTSLTGGVIDFQVSFDGTTFRNMIGYRDGTETSGAVNVTMPLTSAWRFNVAGAQLARVIISTVLKGAGSAVVGLSASAFPASANLVTAQGPTGTVATSWFTQITDATTGPVAVKAASTAAVAADKALVVRAVQLPAAVGQTTMAASLPVVIASDQSAVAVSGTVTTSPPSNASTNVAQLAGTATSVNSGVKDAGTLRVVLATDQPALTNKLLVTPDSVALPANQSVNVSQVNATTVLTGTGATGTGAQRVTVAVDSATVAGSASLPAGTNVIGHVIADTGSTTAVTGNVTVVQATPANLTATVTPIALTKGTQGATGFSVQELKDAGRNQTNWFHAAPIACTNAEVMQTLTGYKGGIAVAATATPSVVTAGKTYRIDKLKVTIIALTAIGSARINLRANLSGVAVVGSPLVMSYQVGIPAIFTAGSAETYSFDYSEGMEFAAGTGIAIGVIGEGADGTTGTAVAKVMVSIHGFEY